MCDPSGVVPLFILVICLGFCAYTMFGYPLLLAFHARLRHRDVRKAPKQATVSVILPVHNGERFIGTKLESILALDYPPELVEILVISDGSTDATHEIVRSFATRGNLDLIVMPRAGKAAALNAGMERATGEIFFFTDVRQELSRKSLANLVECFADPEVGAASGELIIRDGRGTEEASVGLYWKYEKWIRKSLSRVDSVLGATGCIYAMRADLATPMPEGTLVDDMFLPLAAFFQGYRVILDESALAYDYPTQLASEFRRKVRTLAGVYQVIGQYPQLLTWHNRMWIHFFSHKLARLLMPWAMLAAFFAAVALPAPWNTWAVMSQFAGYGLAALNLVMPDGALPKRLTAPAFTFVVLMAASLCAVSIFFVPAGSLWSHTQVSAAHGRKEAKAPE